ncbi:MAG: hypothetical protein ACFFCQ_03080, partial [Promethearchaeota archaeon]
MMDVDRNGTWDAQLSIISGYGYGYKMPTYEWQSYEPVSLNFSYLDSTVEMNASLLDLEFPKAMDLMFLCSPYDSGYTMSLYTMGSNNQIITVDGEATDWTGNPFFVDDVGEAVAPGLDLQEFWIGDNGTDLFVMMNTSGTLDLGANAQVFVDNYYMFIDMYSGNYTFAHGTVIEFSTLLAEIGNPSNVSISGGIRSLGTYMDEGKAMYTISEMTTTTPSTTTTPTTTTPIPTSSSEIISSESTEKPAEIPGFTVTIVFATIIGPISVKKVKRRIE